MNNVPVWDTGGWDPLPPLEGDVETDVCVVGLGGSGLTAVNELVRLGASVIGVDAGAVGGGAAGRNGGFLLAGPADAYHRARDPELYHATLDELDRMETDTPDLVRRTGSLRIASSPEEERDCDEQRAALAADGFDVEPYEGPEGRGLLFPRDAATNPLERCRALAHAALAGGAGLFERSPALGIGQADVTTPTATIRCLRVIVAVDGGLERLLPELAPGVRTTRLQMLATAPAPEVSFPRPVYARWGFDYWQQLPDRRVALGGLRDEFEADEWSYDATPTASVQEALERLLRRLGVEAAVTHRWAGCVAFSRGHSPVAEEVRPGVYGIGAYSGTGNVIGSLLGRAAARWAVG